MKKHDIKNRDREREREREFFVCVRLGVGRERKKVAERDEKLYCASQ